MDDRTRELISSFHDGELPASDQAEVRRLLKSDPEARAFFGSLQDLSTFIASAPKRNAPEGSLAAILGQVGADPTLAESLETTERVVLPELPPPHTSAPPARRGKIVPLRAKSWFPAAAAAAVVLLAFGLTWGWQSMVDDTRSNMAPVLDMGDLEHLRRSMPPPGLPSLDLPTRERFGDGAPTDSRREFTGLSEEKAEGDKTATATGVEAPTFFGAPEVAEAAQGPVYRIMGGAVPLPATAYAITMSVPTAGATERLAISIQSAVMTKLTEFDAVDATAPADRAEPESDNAELDRARRAPAGGVSGEGQPKAGDKPPTSSDGETGRPRALGAPAPAEAPPPAEPRPESGGDQSGEAARPDPASGTWERRDDANAGPAEAVVISVPASRLAEVLRLLHDLSGEQKAGFAATEDVMKALAGVPSHEGAPERESNDRGEDAGAVTRGGGRDAGAKGAEPSSGASALGNAAEPTPTPKPPAPRSQPDARPSGNSQSEEDEPRVTIVIRLARS